MTKNLPATTGQKPKSVLMAVADRYGMVAESFEATLRGTVFPEKGTREQFAAFLVVANEYRLNPITKQIYAFPAKGGGIVPVVGIDGWIHLVNGHPQMNGMEFEFENNASGDLISCTCRIYRKDRTMPTVITEFLDECYRATEPWRMKRRMLRHKALIQCARVAFGFSGIHDEDEARDIVNSDAPLPPPPPPPPAGAVAGRDAGAVEDAVIVEPEKPADEKPVDPVGDVVGEEEEDPFEFEAWIEDVRGAFATCQTEKNVDEANDIFSDTAENLLTREQRTIYQEIHEAALTRVTDQPEEDAPAAPPPPAAAKKADPAPKAEPKPAADALAMDDDEEEEQLTPGAAYIARGDAVLADPKVTVDAINSFWLDTKEERAGLKKSGEASAEDLAALNSRFRVKADAIRQAQAPQSTVDEAGADSSGPEVSDLDKRVAAFTAEFEKRMNEIESMSELTAYFSSTLGTRNSFGLELNDPRVKAWKTLKAERTAQINATA